MEYIQKLNVAFAAVFIVTGITGGIFYSFVFYSLGFVILCVIFLSLGVFFYFLMSSKRFPRRLNFGCVMHERLDLRIFIYIEAIFLAYAGIGAFVAMPAWFPYSVLLLIFGLSWTGLALYILVTVRRKKIVNCE